MDWVSLHTHSTYSYLDGYGQPSAHVQRVTDLGMGALALTEHGNVSSHVRLEKAADKAGGGFRGIYGAELYTGPVDPEHRSRFKWHLGVIALDTNGYQNLMQIVTESWEEENFHQFPTVSGDNLAGHSDGLAVLSGCNGSKLACDLIGGKGIPKHAPDSRAAENTAGRFRDLFGDRYFMEVQAFPALEDTCLINPAYETIAKKLSIPLVATCDVHYPFPDDNEMQMILHAAGRGGPQYMQDQTWEYDVRLTYPKSDEKLRRKLIQTGLSPSAARGAIDAAATLAERAQVRLPHAERLRFPVPDDMDAFEYLELKVSEGYGLRGLDSLKRKKSLEYAARIEREMKMIEDKDLADFFLATADVITWAKAHGIAVGPARGSAAASLVCYLLGITEINPMRYPLMMLERFLDPARPDMPDIDLDFDDERRDEIRLYLVSKYGEAYVGNIGNFIRYRAKNSLVDVARVLNVPRAEVAKVNELVTHRSDGDMRLDTTLADTFETFPVAAEVLRRNPELIKATRLEGNMRGMSVHAAGLVVGTRPLYEIAAMYTRSSGAGNRRRDLQVLSLDKYDAEYLDCLKMDFLGLTTMGMISHALELAGLELRDLYAITDHDKKVMKAFARNDVIGIFQFEGRATRLVNRQVQPEDFMDLADINALSRPGPLFSGTTSEYVKTKHGTMEAESLHPALDEITRGTRGQIIYQEQIIQVVRSIGGFDWTDANSVRRIIAKKLGEAAFNINFAKFAEGAQRLHGIDEELSMKIWKRLVTAGTYAFNTAHSVSYAVLAWWCMWLKVHYPLEFYTASLMKAETGKNGIPVVRKLLKDAEVHGIRHLPPDPAASGVTWTLDRDTGTIRAGFAQVPGIGDVTAAAIVAARASTPGGFSEWKDLLKVKGIGPVTMSKIADWASNDDPFGVSHAARFIAQIRDAIASGDLPGVPMPTHISDELSNVSWAANSIPGARSRNRRKRVVYCGVVAQREYKDIIEDQRARTGAEIEEIKKNLRRPDLNKFATLRCRDAGDEDVYLRFHRMRYRKFAAQIDSVKVGTDAVVAVGYETKGFGAAIQVDKLWVIDPDD